MKRIAHVTVLLIVGAAVSAAGFPPPEDVLRPEPDEFPYWYLQPSAGIGYSFLTGDAVRPLSAGGIGELENENRTSGSALGLELGVDLGVMWSESFGNRAGVFLARRAAGNDGSATAECTLSEGGVVVGTIEEAVAYDYSIVSTDLGLRVYADYHAGPVQFSLGLAASLPLSTEYTESNTIVDTASECFYYSDGATRVMSGSVSKSQLFDAVRQSALIGAAYRHSIGDEVDLVFGIEYDHPLADVWGEPTSVDLESEQIDTHDPVTVPLNSGSRLGTLYARIGLRFNDISL